MLRIIRTTTFSQGISSQNTILKLMNSKNNSHNPRHSPSHLISNTKFWKQYDVKRVKHVLEDYN